MNDNSKDYIVEKSEIFTCLILYERCNAIAHPLTYIALFIFMPQPRQTLPPGVKFLLLTIFPTLKN